MKLNQIKLHCYAEKDADGDWFAICLQLNISATASSYKEVKGKLENMIKEYLREALTTDKNYIDDLIPRRAPFYFYKKYYFYKLVQYLRNHTSSKKAKHKAYNTALPIHV